MKKSKKNELRYNEDDERTLLEDILDFVKVFVISAIVIYKCWRRIIKWCRTRGYSRCNHGRKWAENTLGKTCNRITW